MRFNANKIFIQCDNAVFSASQIRAKFIEMVVSGDLTIESLRDTFMSESNSSEINGSLAAVFSTVHGVTNYRSNLDPKLGIVPHLRIAKEEEITKKVNSLAELIGTEKFYLKVGGLLYKKGADVGLKPDGLVVKSDAEKIEAERILSENIPSEHSRKRKVINPSLGELMACMGQVDEFRNIRAQFITQRLAEGASMKQATEEEKQLTELLETPEVKKSYKELKKINSKLIEIAKKLERFEKNNQDNSQTLSKTQMEQFLQNIKNSIEYQTLVKERDGWVRQGLLKLTRFRHSVDDWAKRNPGYTYMADIFIDTVGYTVAIVGTIATASTIVASAEVSVPVAVGTYALQRAGKSSLRYIGQKLIEWTGHYGITEQESRDFQETTAWVTSKVSKLIDIVKFGKIVKKSAKPFEDISNGANSLYKITQFYRISKQIKDNSVSYISSKRNQMLQEILSELMK